ncbi:DUF3152 domain-containing protein [Amycolatopsis australiensis]|uniref:DUF3152 domain-containing protein n=1 Tax=Amycolatopsis australiensis TaxID=546364 RepID=A0A1K1SQ82_9PSEU|nr:DUF3152 domain-containing protein [Amycolatopsis australiensis]SFW86029.1 Protein of unknown function [Amycolatopsis australiensis]
MLLEVPKPKTEPEHEPERETPAQPVPWWPPAVLVFAVALAVTLLLLPRAAEPRRLAGAAQPMPLTSAPTTTAKKPAPAELPDGGPVTPAGAGTWRVQPGPQTLAGTGGKEVTYTIEVEDGVDAPGFAGQVDAILADPRGWIGRGEVRFRRETSADAEPQVRISLTTPATSRRLCGFAIPYDSSCHLTHRIVVNLARWVRGAHSFDGDLTGYRAYAVNHEMGHELGFGHVGCPAPGAPAPVMMQQTFGLSNSYLADLNRAEPGAATRVPADGAVCRPNPWVG